MLQNNKFNFSNKKILIILLYFKAKNNYLLSAKIPGKSVILIYFKITLQTVIIKKKNQRIHFNKIGFNLTKSIQVYKDLVLDHRVWILTKV